MADPRMYPGGVKYIKHTVTAASVATIVVVEQTFTVPGVEADDVIVSAQSPANSTATGIAGVRVSAVNTIAIRYVNPTAGSLTPTAGDWVFGLVRAPAG